MSSPTKAHRERAVELLRLFAHANAADLIAAALSDTESTAYARGLADGAERERAAVVAYLWKRQRIIAAPIAEEVESGKHLEQSE